jgi:hypothetical protein
MTSPRVNGWAYGGTSFGLHENPTNIPTSLALGFVAITRPQLQYLAYDQLRYLVHGFHSQKHPYGLGMILWIAWGQLAVTGRTYLLLRARAFLRSKKTPTR